MSFGAPAYLVFLLLVPLLIALYFRKSRPMRKVLPSTKLWDLVLKRLASDSLFHRYRHSVFLALQLTVLLALVFGLARPHLSRSLSGRTILVIDTSASMRATDVAPSRFDAARNKALALLARVDSGGDVALVTADSRVSVRSAFGADLGTTIALVRGLEATDHPGPDLTEVAGTIEALQRQRADRVIVLTDQLSGEDLVTRLRGVSVTVHAFGSSGDNAALTRFEVRSAGRAKVTTGAAEGGSDTAAEDRWKDDVGGGPPSARPALRARSGQPPAWDGVAQVTSFAASPLKGMVELSQGGKVLAKRPVELRQRGDATVRFEGLALGEGLVEARLVVASGNDHLAADDRAWTQAGRQAATVLLLGRERGALARVLKTIPGMDLKVVSARDAGAPGALPPADITVAEDAYHPELAARSALILAGTGELGSPSGPWLEGSPAEDPVPTRFEITHPVLKYISFKDVSFSEAGRLRREPGDVEVLGASGLPLVLARARGPVRQVLCAFTTDTTDFAMRVSFPIFVMNALRWIGGGRLEGGGGVRLGEPYRLPAGSAARANLTAPDGKPVAWSGADARVIPAEAFARAGVYALGGAKPVLLAASLGAFAESNIAPAQEKDVAREHKGAQEGATPMGLARWLIGLALCVMLVEWALYARMGG